MSRTFEEASRQIQASLQKHLENAKDFSESEDSDDSGELDGNSGIQQDEIIQRVFGSYNNLSGTDVRTKEALVQSIGSGKDNSIIWTTD